MQDLEKLGAFYLGRRYDADKGEVLEEPILYDAKDLTTHAVCVGMTGSGKTGLGVGLIEEAALDGIPVLAIDPKGDLGNLLLTFPKLRPEDFRPWIDESEAARKGRSPDEHAQWTAELWRKGLGQWGQKPARIGRFAKAAERVLYTPGSRAGVPLSIMRSFDAPPPALAEDDDALRERILSAVSGLLALLGLDADPIRSREHILLSTLLDRAWREGRDLDLPTLIREIQSPPFERVGVFDLDSFFPSKERFELAMTLNNLLASPGFAAWAEGEPLDVGRLLYTEEGKPKLSILSISHLSDTERMSFVTLLLGEVLAWCRSQPGSRSLRALLYMDEVFGYFPPVANPPSKAPMLTLLKQARAFGLGVVLATQNPVDLDYKGLSNAGTWFLGRLQTERDKARVLEGLEGASTAAGASFDRSRLERILAGLDSRVFLMNNVHDDEPVLFHTRWVLSYLAGPLTRDQIRRLSAERGGAAKTKAASATRSSVTPSAPSRAAASRAASKAAVAASEASDAPPRPILPGDIPETFLRVTQARGAAQRLVYRPALLAQAVMHYANARAKVDEWENVTLLAPLDEVDTAKPWEGASELKRGMPAEDAEPEASAGFGELPVAASKARSYTRWEKMLKTHLYRSRPLQLWKCRELKAISKVGESEGEFRARLRDLGREQRDLKIEKLRRRYAPKLDRLEEQIRRARQRVEKEEAQYKQQKTSTMITVGTTVLGALFGRKLKSAGSVRSAGTAMRRAGRVSKEKEDIAHAVETLETKTAALKELESEFEVALQELRDASLEDELELEEVKVSPRKSDLGVDQLVLAWTPWTVDANGMSEPAF